MVRGAADRDRQSASLSYDSRHSPAFWVALLAGSVTLHVLGFGLVIKFLPSSAPPVTDRSTPVDLVELEAIPSPTQATVIPSQQPQVAALQTPPTPSTSLTLPEPEPQLAPQPQPEAAPSLPKPIATPRPAPPQSSSSPASRQPPRTAPPVSPTTAPNPVPGIGSPTAPGGTDPELPEAGVTPNSAPAQFRVTVAIASSNQDVASRPAQPKTLTQTLVAGTTDCNPTPESNRFLGATVELLVEIDLQGKPVPEQTLVQQSVDAAYDALAVCLVNQWEFTPAADQQGDNWQPRRDNLRLSLTITQLNTQTN